MSDFPLFSAIFLSFFCDLDAFQAEAKDILTGIQSFCNMDNPRWGCSSAGRVLDWQSRGRGFDPHQLHHLKISFSPG